MKKIFSGNPVVQIEIIMLHGTSDDIYNTELLALIDVDVFDIIILG